MIDFNYLNLDITDFDSIKEAVKNNPNKFPQGYIFQLSKLEKMEVVKNFDHIFLIQRIIDTKLRNCVLIFQK